MADVDMDQVEEQPVQVDNPHAKDEKGAEDDVGFVESEQESEARLLQYFLSQMDDYTPAIPDAVTNYYLKTAGFDCPDDKVVRMIALAAQKFVSDIANDALQRQKTAQAVSKNRSKGEKKHVLTMDDLQYALAQHGVNVRKPAYFK